MSMDMVRLESDSCAVRLYGEFCTPILLQHRSEIVMRLGESRIQPYCRLKCLDRFLDPPESPKDIAKIVVVLGNRRQLQNRSANEVQCHFVISGLAADYSQQMQRVGLSRLLRQDFAIERLGLT